MRASGPDMAANLEALERETRGASAGQRDPAPKRPADHLRVFAARLRRAAYTSSLGLAAAHSTPDEERSVAGFRPDMTVVKAQQDFLTHEDSAPRERATMELERSPRTECGSRDASIVRTPRNRGCAQRRLRLRSYRQHMHPGSLLTSACRPWKNWPISRTLCSAHHAARRCVNCAGREPNPSRFADTAALSVKTVEKNEARSRCTNSPTGARP